MRFNVQYTSPYKLGAPYYKTVTGDDINECMEVADLYARKHYVRGKMERMKDYE